MTSPFPSSRLKFASFILRTSRRCGAIAAFVLVGSTNWVDARAASCCEEPSRRADAKAVDRRAAVAALQAAVDNGDAEASRMLGSLHERGTPPDSRAIELYRFAEKNGNAKAAARLDRLRAEGAPVPFAEQRDAMFSGPGEIVPIGKLNEMLEPGYHCHYLRAGQMWCHAGMQ